MKNKIFLVTTLCIFYSVSYSHPKDSLKIDSVINSVSYLTQKVKKIEIENEQLKEKETEKADDMEHVVFLLKLATWGVDALVLISALFAIYHFWSFSTEKKKISVKLKEVGKKQLEIDKVSHRILGAQAYNKIGFENLFAFIEDYINSRKGEQKTKDSLHLKRGIIYIYDDNTETRKLGIFILSQYGNLEDIKHLEKNLSDPDESEDNKKVALEAIIQIRDRFRLLSEDENERFKAISVLIQNGSSEDIAVLEKIISNTNESKRNKELAKDAIEAIKLKIKK